MKRVIIAILVFATVGGKGNAQNYDDGNVTRYLRVNMADSKYSIFAENFRKGIETVKSGKWTSVDDITAATGVDLRKFPRLGQLGNGTSETGISNVFIKKVTEAVNNTGVVYKTVGEFRNELANIARGTSLTDKDAEMLALVDIATQEMTNSLITDEPAAALGNVLTSADAGLSIGDNTERQKMQEHTTVMISDLKLPFWVRCALGTIGSAIAGGIAGAGTGATLGSVIPGVGTALGGAIGGLGGVISGTFLGIATFCD